MKAEIISDLFVNLAAGWIGAVLIFPINQNKPRKIRLWLLTANISFATLALLFAYLIKKYGS